MFIRLIILLFILAGISKPQFSDVEISLDLRSVKKYNYFILDDLKEEIDRYIETTIFSQNDTDLEIPLKIYIVIESISEKGAFKTINTQFFISNNLDLNVFSRVATIPYYKGKSMNLTTDFNPTSSLFDYFAYIFLANELDMYSSLGGNEFFNEAEKIALYGKESDYPGGWDNRLKKCKKLMENVHLRNFRYHWYEIKFAISKNNQLEEEDNTIDINKLLIELENDIYYLQEFYPNDRNAFLFLDIYSDEIGALLGEMKMYDALVLLSNYDADNASTYNSFIK